MQTVSGTENTNNNKAENTSFSGTNANQGSGQSFSSATQQYSAPSNMFSGNRSDILNSFINEARNQVKATSPVLEIDIKAVDSKLEELPMDGAIFTYMLGKVAVIAYVGIVNTCQQLSPRTANNGHQTIQYDMYPQDIVTDARALEAIRRISKIGLVASDKLSTVPVYISLNSSPADAVGFSEEVKGIMHTVWSAMQVSIAQFLRNNKSVPDTYKTLNGNQYMTAGYVAKISGPGSSVEITHERRDLLTMKPAAGVPVNPDIILSAAVRGKGREDTMWSSSISNVVKVGINADIMRAGEPRSDAEGRIIPGQSATKPSQWYYPVLRISSIETDAPSVASTLLGIITATAPFANNNAYIYPFMADKKDMKSKMSKLNHIGSVWAECSFLHVAPEKTAGNSNSEMLSLPDADKALVISNILRNKPRFFMNCSALNSDFCFTSLIKEAAHKSVNGVMSNTPTDINAYNEFFAAADELTGGVFSTKFKKGTPIAVTTDALRPIGTLETEDGVQNINKITYMALVNQYSGKKEQLESMAEYTNNLYGGNGDSPRVRMQKNIQLVSGVFGNIKVLGYGEEIELNGEMVQALINSYIQSGVPINVPDLGQVVNNNTDRAFFGDQFGGTWGGANTNQGFGGNSGFTNGGSLSNSQFEI